MQISLELYQTQNGLNKLDDKIALRAAKDFIYRKLHESQRYMWDYHNSSFCSHPCHDSLWVDYIYLPIGFKLDHMTCFNQSNVRWVDSTSALNGDNKRYDQFKFNPFALPASTMRITHPRDDPRMKTYAKPSKAQESHC